MAGLGGRSWETARRAQHGPHEITLRLPTWAMSSGLTTSKGRSPSLAWAVYHLRKAHGFPRQPRRPDRLQALATPGDRPELETARAGPSSGATRRPARPTTDSCKASPPAIFGVRIPASESFEFWRLLKEGIFQEVGYQVDFPLQLGHYNQDLEIPPMHLECKLSTFYHPQQLHPHLPSVGSTEGQRLLTASQAT
jgi:hypothetical protein